MTSWLTEHPIDLISAVRATDALLLEPKVDGKQCVEVVDGRSVWAAPGHVAGEAAIGDGGVTAVPCFLQVGDERGDNSGGGVEVTVYRHRWAR